MKAVCHLNGRRKPRVRRALLRRHGSRCWLCGDFMMAEDISIDHVIPRCKGGTNELENLRLAHTTCNNARGDADGIAFERMGATRNPLRSDAFCTERATVQNSC